MDSKITSLDIRDIRWDVWQSRVNAMVCCQVPHISTEWWIRCSSPWPWLLCSLCHHHHRLRTREIWSSQYIKLFLLLLHFVSVCLVTNYWSLLLNRTNRWHWLKYLLPNLQFPRQQHDPNQVWRQHYVHWKARIIIMLSLIVPGWLWSELHAGQR